LDNWVLDSGATQHMTSRADILTDIRPSKLRIKVAIGTHCYPCGHRFLDDQQYKWTPAYQAASYLTSSWHGSEPDLYFRSDPSWSSSHLQRHLRWDPYQRQQVNSSLRVVTQPLYNRSECSLGYYC
jgi:hypothetical protein